MDMKRILQAMDGVATKPVVGVNDMSDMSKFVSIIKQNDVSILNEGASPHKVSLPVQMAMQHYQQEEPAHKPVGRDSVIRKYFKEVEEELVAEKAEKRQLINQYASIIAERVLMKESLDEACWDKYKQVGMKKKGRKMVPNCVPKESVKENEIPGHSMGFTGGVGPGAINNVIDEMPINFNKEVPGDSEIHSHQGVNPASINARIMRARGQLKDLATRAQSNDLLVWESISRQFPELAMNIEQIRHGIEELAKIRKGGGRRVHNINKHIGEAVMPAIKAAKPAAPKAVKPKAKTSVCRAGQTQTGTQIKNGVSVPKCSVTTVKKKVAEAEAPAPGQGAQSSLLPRSNDQDVFNSKENIISGIPYTLGDLAFDLGIIGVSAVAGAVGGPAGEAAALAANASRLKRLATLIRAGFTKLGTLGGYEKTSGMATYLKSVVKSLPVNILTTATGSTIFNTMIGVWEKMSKDDSGYQGVYGKLAGANRRAAVRNYNTTGNPSPALYPEKYPTN